MMGTRGDVLTSRKPFLAQMARHRPVQGVVEEGRGRAGGGPPPPSKVSQIAGMFQGGGMGGGTGGGTGRDADPEGPPHASVVRTESHLARFHTARALFEKMGRGPQGPCEGPLSQRAPRRAPTTDPREDRKEEEEEEEEEEATPSWEGKKRRGSSGCRFSSSSSSSSSSSRPGSPSPSGTANGRALEEEEEEEEDGGGCVPPLPQPQRKPEPPPKRKKSEDPLPPPSSPPRRLFSSSQNRELIARHKNWFQSFCRSRANPAQLTPGKPLRGASTTTTTTSSDEEEKREDKAKKEEGEEGEGGEEGGGGDDDEGGGGKRPRKFSEEEAWSSVLQNRYGPRAKDLLSPRKPEGDAATDWRKERAAILAGRSCRSAAEEVKGQRFEEAATLQSDWSPPRSYGQWEAAAPAAGQSEAAFKTLKEERNRTPPPRRDAESVVLKDAAKEKDAAERRPSASKQDVDAANARLKEAQRRDAPAERGAQGDALEKRDVPAERGAQGDGAEKRDAPAERGAPREVSEKRDAPAERGGLRDAPAERGVSRDDFGKRGGLRDAIEKRDAPAERGTPRDASEKRDAPAERGGLRDAFEKRDAPAERGVSRDDFGKRGGLRDAIEKRDAPAEMGGPKGVSEKRDAPAERGGPRDDFEKRDAPAERSVLREAEQRDAPTERSAPRDDFGKRDAPAERGVLRDAFEKRDAPAERGAPRDTEKRDAPAERDVSAERGSPRDAEKRDAPAEKGVLKDAFEKRDAPTERGGQRDVSGKRDAPAERGFPRDVSEKRDASTERGFPKEAFEKMDAPAEKDVLRDVSEKRGASTERSVSAERGVPRVAFVKRDAPTERGFPRDALAERGGLRDASAERGVPKDVSEKRDAPAERGVSRDAPAERVFPKDVSEKRDAPAEKGLPRDVSETRDAPAERGGPRDAPAERGAPKDAPGKRDAPAEGGRRDDAHDVVLGGVLNVLEAETVFVPEDVSAGLGEEDAGATRDDSRAPQEGVAAPAPVSQSLAALDALIHGGRPSRESPGVAAGETHDFAYDHTVTSAQHKIQFCTAPVTVEGLTPDPESHDTDPEPLPPPIPPHGVEPASITEVQPMPTSQPEDPEVMTADEAQRLLSANILEGKVRESQSLLSDEEAQEVVLLLSPQEHDTSGPVPPVPQHFSDAPPAVPPHYTEIAPPVPPHYTPGEDEYDTRVASHFDPTLTSPLSPEDEPSEADSSEASGDVYQVSRVKEVLVEDGVHYLEDGHFWVEVPGLPEEDEDDENDPSMPYHPHTKLTFSKDPVQVFSTYSVTEYDRKNDEVDPVAASAEYELEKRVEKMDLFPVEIVKGEGGLGLSIIGMGVGADAGVEKLGIFVKTITQGGATERDGRIQVNDQIIEVDGKSLVGVTQVFAASVLKNTSGRVHFLIGREKDPENSEVALLIKQSLQADREREERRRALGGPDYDPHTGQSLFDPLSSPSEENSRSEDMSVQHNYSSYLEGPTSPTSPEATSPPPEVFDLEGDTSDTSPDNDVSVLKLKLKEVQYRNAVAKAEITKLKMSLLEMEKVVTENTKYTSQLLEAQNKMADLDTQLQSKLSEVSTYQDMLEQSQGQFIVLEKKYYKAKKIIKEYQGRERDFLHREEYHITQLEEKDSHYNALVKALKDRVIQLEGELTNAQKKAGLPIQVPSDPSTQPAYWNLQQNTQSALAKQPPRKPSLCTLDPEISDTETSDTGTSEGDKSNTVERKIPVKEELDEAVPPHELLDVSASRAKGELASRGGLANRHLPSLKKTTSMSSASSQEQSLDDSSLDDDLPEAVKHPPVEATQDGQQDQGSRRSAETQEPLPPHSPPHTTSSISYAKSPQPPSYTQATMGNVSHLGNPPPYLHPPGQFGTPRQPLASSHISSDPSTGLPTRPLGAAIDSQTHDSRSESRPEIPYRHPPPVARVQPVNRAEISESTSLASHLASRTPQQQSLAEQLKALLAERELESDITQQRNEREASPSKRSPTSLMEDVRQAVMQADVTSHVVSGQLVHQVSPPQRSQSTFYSTGGRESARDSNAGSQSPRIGRSSLHTSPGSGVSASPSGVVLLSQRPLDSSIPAHKLGPGVDGSSGDLSSGPASLGSGDEGSGASLGSQSSLSHTHPPTERTKRSHMWQTAPVVDWTKEQVSQWLVVQGLESCVGRFQDVGMTGPRLLNLDVRDLKALGLPPEEKTKLKRKVKELRIAVEKERKQAEKEKKEREKLQKKAEKLAEKAERKKK